MNTRTTIAGSALALALIVGVNAPTASAANVVDAVVADDSFQQLENVLLLADELTDAGLVPTLQNAEDITVFAPTNEAFEKLPRTLSRAIENDPSILVTILQYHVAPAPLLAEDVVETRRIDTLAGENIRVRTIGDTVFLDRSRVTAVDTVVDNNVVVHRIDRVMVPWRSVIRDVIQALRQH